MALSETEFQRLQEQLLELRTCNYQLQEENTRLKHAAGNEVVGNGVAKSAATTPTRHKADDPFARANKFLSRATGGLKGTSHSAHLANGCGGDAHGNDEHAALHKELDTLRRALQSQEEQFHLQQMTMRNELEQLQQERAAHTDIGAPSRPTASSSCQTQCEETSTSDTEQPQDELPTRDVVKESEFVSKVGQLHNEILTLKDEVSGRSERIEQLSLQCTGLEEAKELLTAQHKSTVGKLNGELGTLNEEHRLKQESYAELCEQRNAEKAQYESQIERLMEEKSEEHCCVGKLEEELQVARGLNAEVARRCDAADKQLSEVKQQVGELKEMSDEAKKIAEERKALLEQMARHVDTMKAEYEDNIKRKEGDYESRLVESESTVADLKAEQGQWHEMTEKYSSLQKEIERLQDQCGETKKALDAEQLMSKQREEEYAKKAEYVSNEHQAELQQLKCTMDEQRSALQAEIDELNVENGNLCSRCDMLKEEVADKGDAINVIEKKFKGMLKELSKQVALEKRRNEKLEENVKELANGDYLNVPSAHSQSPAQGSFEEVKSTDYDGRRANDAASVCSWQMVADNGRNNSCGSVRAATVTQNDCGDSVCSNSNLDTDTTDLIVKVTALQRDKYEMMERLHVVEREHALMGKQLLNKSKVIEQFIKEKPCAVSSEGVTLKDRVVSMMKVDQSAADIHQMNKHLQLMLEEALMKNMALEKNLEKLAQDFEHYQKGVQNMS